MRQEIKEKAKQLTAMSQHNFSNRVLSETCHFEDLAKNPNHWHFITDNYDGIMAELKKNPHKASPALATLATSGCFKSSEFLDIVKEANKASSAELKEFFELREQHAGGGLRMIDYLSFPLVVRMTKNIPSAERIDLIMTKPELLSDKIYMYPALMELTSDERTVLMEKATPEQKEHLENVIAKADNPLEIVHYTARDLSGGYLWLVCVEAQSRYGDIKKARQTIPQHIAQQKTVKLKDYTEYQRS